MPPPNRVQLRDFVAQHFNRSEVELLCADAFPDFYRNYEGVSVPLDTLVLELVAWCEERGSLEDLRLAVHAKRLEPYELAFGCPRITNVTARPRDPKQIFISYAYEDSAFARKLEQDLRAAGFAVWIAPDNIQPGE